MNAIVAVSENWGIGKDNALLFHIRADLQRFKALTTGHTVVMGRRTLESLPGGRGLPGRRNLVLSTRPDFAAERAEVVRSLDEAMYYWNAGIRNVMFCCEISSREMFDAYDACPIPWDYIMAYIRLSVDPRLQEVYDLLHERGVSTMTSITGSSDKVKNPRDRRVCYLRDLVSEPDLIETDYPSEFVDLPRSRAEIHALQDRAIEGNRSVKADKAKKNRRK